MTLQALEQARHQQALSLAYFDVFWCSAAISVVMVLLVLLMRRSVADKGAHIAAE
jgi:DHA2 family multidrug resistance protein